MRDWKRRLTTGFATLQLFGLRIEVAPSAAADGAKPKRYTTFAHNNGGILWLKIMSQNDRMIQKQ